MAIIYLVRMLPSGSSGLPGDYRANNSNSRTSRQAASLFDLASGVVYLASNVTIRAVGFYPAFSPLPRSQKTGEVYFLWH